MLCRFCQVNPINLIANLGNQPLANNFLSEHEFSDEYFFNLSLYFCPECKLVQLKTQPKPELMFHENYKFHSQTSKRMISHFENTAEILFNRFIENKDDSGVLEIGSNDGIFLQNFLGKVEKLLGVDPSTNVTEISKNMGIEVVDAFFSENTAKAIFDAKGNFNLIYAANVICHIPDLRDLLLGVNCLLKQDGVFVFEEPYLGDLIENNSYDQVYDEHVYIFSASAINEIAQNMGMELFDCERLWTHGGSMRYFLAPMGKQTVSSTVLEVLESEEKMGLTNYDVIIEANSRFQLQAKMLKDLLTKLKFEGNRIVGYGATSKSATILNYSNIGVELLDYICDTTESKQGLYSPGKHIPIVPYEYFKSNHVDYVLLFAWNHKNEIFEKEKSGEKNFRWILPFPFPEILEKNA